MSIIRGEDAGYTRKNIKERGSNAGNRSGKREDKVEVGKQ